jgi:hypothetical protein
MNLSHHEHKKSNPLPFNVGDIVSDGLGKEHVIMEIDPQADDDGGLVWTRRLSDGVIFGSTIFGNAFTPAEKRAP